MAAHKYWKFVFNGTDSIVPLTISGIEMHTSLGGANVANTTGWPGPTVINRAANILGPASLPLIQNVNIDDSSTAVTLPFAVEYYGSMYTTVYVGSNSYLTFGAGASTYSGISATNPQAPSIQINAADRSSQRVYAGSENSNGTFRIRYEGSTGTSGTIGSPTIVWEVTFNASSPATILIDIGTNAASGSGTSGISDGYQYRSTLPNGTVNTGYTISIPAGDGTTISASSGKAASAFDADSSTLWQPTAFPNWLIYEFPTAQTIVEHSVKASASSPTAAPCSWNLYNSDDGTTWNLDTSVINQHGWTASQVRTFTNGATTLSANSPITSYPYLQTISTAISPSTITATTKSIRFSSTIGLATPATSLSGIPLQTSRSIPWWAVDARGYFPNTGVSTVFTNTNLGYSLPTVGIPVNGQISGQVQEAGTPVAGRLLRLYYKPTGQLISSQYSDSSGNYSFVGLEAGATEYVVTAFNVLPLQYDAVIHDNITAL